MQMLRFSEPEGNFKACRRICDELDIPSHCANDYEAMHDLCSNVSERSAGIVAAGDIFSCFRYF